MTQSEIIVALAQGLLALGVFSVRSQIISIRELFDVRLDSHEKRLDNLEKK